MKIRIKNMVCDRCKMAVQSVLNRLELHPLRIDLGEVVLQEKDISEIKYQLKSALQALGFDLLDDKKSQTIESIKTLIIHLVQNKEADLQRNLSDYLSLELHQDYSALSNLFSTVEGITIEKYFILQKIEKVKELLLYDELNLNEIAFRLHYSSSAYLSNQFKKVIGISPLDFKKQRVIKRKPLDKL